MQIDLSMFKNHDCPKACIAAIKNSRYSKGSRCSKGIADKKLIVEISEKENKL